MCLKKECRVKVCVCFQAVMWKMPPTVWPCVPSGRPSREPWWRDTDSSRPSLWHGDTPGVMTLMAHKEFHIVRLWHFCLLFCAVISKIALLDHVERVGRFLWRWGTSVMNRASNHYHMISKYYSWSEVHFVDHDKTHKPNSWLPGLRSYTFLVKYIF